MKPFLKRPAAVDFAAGACALLLAATPLALHAAESEGQANPVVAEVNGHEITYQDVKTSAEDLPPQYQSQFDRIFPQLLDRLVDMHLLREEAREKNLASDPEVKERLAEARKQVLGQAMLERKTDAAITEARLREAYAQYKQNNPAQDQVRARHILVEDKATAEDLIQKLDGGADFAELAGEHSTGPSGKRGGDLGYFGKGEMVKPFSQAAFGLEAGSHTAEPVKTEFGWHVIKVEDKRSKAPKSFAEMKPQLREQVRQQVTQDVLSKLREGHDVQTYPERRPGAGDGGNAQ